MKCFFYVVILFIICNSANAQSLAINTTGATANASSILDITSTSKGVLVPRMTKTQKNAIATPAVGLLVYQAAPDSIGFHYYNGSQWVWLNPSGGASNDWSITGNTGTDTAVNFIGTTDNMPLAFKVNNEKSGRIESNIATANTFLGSRSGRFNTGTNNTGFGNRALADSVSGSANAAFGAFALNNNKAGSNNTALGFQALTNNTTAGGNTGVGASSLKANTTGSSNTAIGASVLQSNTIGINNSAIGTSALTFNTTGSFNTAIGAGALLANTTGSGNFAIGNVALTSNIGGSDNTAIGSSVLYNNTSGLFNIAVGYQNLFNNTVGDLNIGIGANTLFNNTNRSNLIAIGNSALYNNGTGASQPFHATNNIAVGKSAMEFNTIGNNNIAIGNNAIRNYDIGVSNIALGNNTLANSGGSGSNNTAIGDSALYNNTTGNYNTALGSSTLLKNTNGNANTANGFQALYKNISGNNNVAVGYNALYYNTTSTTNVAVGDYALYFNTISNSNVAIGSQALYNNITGGGNVANGYHALIGNTTGDENIGIGNSVLSLRNGNSNIAIGNLAGEKTLSGTPVVIDNNIFLGNAAGINSSGDNNIFIGTSVGTASTLSNVLAIDNSNTPSPLIFGNFATDLLRINGTLNINSQYSFPIIDGSNNQFLKTNGSGNAIWVTLPNDSTNAANGLNMVGTTIKLGGTLTDSTTITQGNRSMVFDLNGTGDFYVRKNTTSDAFMVKNNGFVGLNTSAPLYRLHIVNANGGNGPFGRGIVIENSNTGSNGEASIAFKNNGPGSVAPNSAWMSGLNNAANYVFAYGDSLIAGNVKMKLDTLGNVSIGNQAALAQSKLDVKGSFGNAIRSITADATLDVDDHTIIIPPSVGATPLIVTLPAAATCDRREYIIVNRNASIKTVSTYNDFTGTATAIPASGSISLQSNGTNWFRIR